MHLSIHKQNLQWSDALADYAERRIRMRLGRLRDRVRSVWVRFADINGPRGGADKRCVLSVRLTGGPEVLVDTRDTCPYRAVDRAVDRLRRSVNDRIERKRQSRRRART